MIENKVVISVSGGNVNGIFTSDPKTKVYLVDYDNLEADPSDDCSQKLPVGRIEEFQSLAVKDNQLFSGIAKLLSRLKE
jgi:hypothetical protein